MKHLFVADTKGANSILSKWYIEKAIIDIAYKNFESLNKCNRTNHINYGFEMNFDGLLKFIS